MTRAPGRRVLSEHKIDALFTTAQLLGYQGWECAARVLVAPDIDRYRDDEGFFKHLTWRQIATKLDELGRTDAARPLGEELAPKWRQGDRRILDRSARLWVLDEVLSFLERQDVGVTSMDPISAHDVGSYAAVAAIRARLRQLFAFIHDHPLVRAL